MNPIDVSEFLKEFKDDNLIPIPISDDSTSKTRMSFQSANMNKHIILRKNRFDVIQESLLQKDVFIDNEALAEYIGKTYSYFDYLINYHNLIGNRLAYIEEGFINVETEDENKAIQEKLFNYCSFFGSYTRTKEWTWKNVFNNTIKLNDNDEICNTLLTLRRQKLLVKSKQESYEINKIRYTIDVNTFQENLHNRFNLDNLQEFVAIEQTAINEIYDSLMEFL
jgi:hypothetical protein